PAEQTTVRRDRRTEAVPVAVAPVTRGSISEQLRISGSLEAAVHVQVASLISGRLLSLSHDLGDHVASGTELARIDDRHIRQAIKEAEAALAVARAQLQETRSDLPVIRRRLQRSRALLDQGTSAQDAHDAIEAEALAAEASVQVAEAAVLEAETALAARRLDLDDSRVRVDWQGPERVVAARLAEAGDFVDDGQALLHLVQLDPLQAVIHVPEAASGRVHQGQAAQLRCDAYPETSFPATVARLAPAFDAETRLLRVELSVPNPDERLKPGMFIRATLDVARADDAMLVPAAALVQRREEPVLFVVADDDRSVRQVPVRIGLRDEGQVQILKPEIAGRVVILGQHLLGDGSAITIPDETP
ncbi:MAG: efflux RND transporter periplasmic adaptor subunit, partial [Planctomycetota bacterium]